MELANLGLGILIFLGPYLLVRWTGGRLIPSIIMLLYTVLSIILSGFMYQEGPGFGPYAMVTIIYFPVLMIYGWIVASISRWWVLRKKANAPLAATAARFGRN